MAFSDQSRSPSSLSSLSYNYVHVKPTQMRPEPISQPQKKMKVGRQQSGLVARFLASATGSYIGARRSN